MGWTGWCPSIFPWKVLCIFKLALGLQTCSPLLLVMCTSEMPWVLPLLKTQLLFLASAHVRLRVLELWGKPLIRHTIVLQLVRWRGFCLLLARQRGWFQRRLRWDLLAFLCVGGGSWQRAHIVQSWRTTTPGLGGTWLGLLTCSIMMD